MLIKKEFRNLVILVILLYGSLFASVGFANCGDTALECIDHKVMEALQRELKNQGFYNRKITGRYDDYTSSSIAKFSKEKNIEDNGELNEKLVNALWGIDIDYKNATFEDRISFLKKINVLKKNKIYYVDKGFMFGRDSWHVVSKAKQKALAKEEFEYNKKEEFDAKAWECHELIDKITALQEQLEKQTIETKKQKHKSYAFDKDNWNGLTKEEFHVRALGCLKEKDALIDKIKILQEQVEKQNYEFDKDNWNSLNEEGFHAKALDCLKEKYALIDKITALQEQVEKKTIETKEQKNKSYAFDRDNWNTLNEEEFHAKALDCLKEKYVLIDKIKALQEQEQSE